MVEMRWVNKAAKFTYSGSTVLLDRVLQIRTRIWITRDADCDIVSPIPVEGATLGWSEWRDVPMVSDTPT